MIVVNAASMAELRTLPPSGYVQMWGYRKPGDGGSGFFSWDEECDRWPNPGTVVAPIGWVPPDSNPAMYPGRWVRGRDIGNGVSILAFGAYGDGDAADGGHDDAPAFAAAIEALGPEDLCWGGLLLVPNLAFRMDDNLVLNRVMTIRGEIGYRNMAASRLLFADGKGVHYVDCPINWGGRNSAGRYAQNTLLQELVIQSKGDGHGVSYPDEGGVVIDRPVCHGVWAQSTYRMKDCFIVGFNGDGIFVDSNSDEGGDWPNCNNFRVDGVSVENCTGWGFHAKGGNAQGGSVVNCFFMSNGRGHVLDESFLGNYYSNPMMHTPLFPVAMQCQGMKIVGDLNKSVVVSGYTEGDCAPSHADGAAVIVGGNYGNGWTIESKAFRIIDWGHVSPFQVVSDPAMRADKGMRTQLGMKGNPIGWQAPGDADDMRVAYGTQQVGYYEWLYQGRVMVGMSGSEAEGGGGQLVFPEGIMLGSGADARRIRFADNTPTGPCKQGERIFYRTVPTEPGSYLGEVCAVAGYSAPKWERLRKFDLTEKVAPTVHTGRYYVCVGEGFSAVTEPAWPPNVGDEVTEAIAGGARWRCVDGTAAHWRRDGRVE